MSISLWDKLRRRLNKFKQWYLQAQGYKVKTPKIIKLIIFTIIKAEKFEKWDKHIQQW